MLGKRGYPTPEIVRRLDNIVAEVAENFSSAPRTLKRVRVTLYGVDFFGTVHLWAHAAQMSVHRGASGEGYERTLTIGSEVARPGG